MKQKFFKVPFAQEGDTTEISITANQDGTVSYPEGWGDDYERDFTTDANAKAVERNVMNTLFHDITDSLGQYQKSGFPEWITPADNDGGSFPYSKSAIVNFDNKLYVSLVDNNNEIPGTNEAKWQPFLYERASEKQAVEGKDKESIITPETLLAGLANFQKVLKPYLLPIGSIMMWPSNTPPEGWLELNGQGFDKNLYPELTKVLPSGVLPDFRGMFPRGWDHGKGIDLNRSLLSEQGDAIRNIEGTFGGNARPSQGTGAFWRKSSGQQGNQTSNDGAVFGFDASRVVPTADENRPKNIAVMFVIKTDLASKAEGDVPTNLIVSPTLINEGVGGSKQLTTTILPSNLSSQYTVNYQSSDTSICTVSSAGIVTLIGAGRATVIASISTGLATTVEIISNIVLTSLQLATTASLTVGDQVTLSYNATPSNFTEPLLFNSSNQNIASVNNNGELICVNAGTSVISVTGAVSGITSSITINIKPAVITETYLKRSDNLSDLDNVATARKNLGLKALAIKDKLTADDVKAVPVSDSAIAARVDLNTVTKAGQYYQNKTSNATTELNYPENVAGVLVVYKTGVDDGCRQEYMPYNSTKVYRRYAFGSPLVFSDWLAC